METVANQKGQIVYLNRNEGKKVPSPKEDSFRGMQILFRNTDITIASDGKSIWVGETTDPVLYGVDIEYARKTKPVTNCNRGVYSIDIGEKITVRKRGMSATDEWNSVLDTILLPEIAVMAPIQEVL